LWQALVALTLLVAGAVAVARAQESHRRSMAVTRWSNRRWPGYVHRVVENRAVVPDGELVEHGHDGWKAIDTVDVLVYEWLAPAFGERQVDFWIQMHISQH
jgi:hypothetical protein